MSEQLLKRDLDHYLEVCEHWKQDHAEAMACYSFEDLIAKGIALFNAIVEADERWRGQVFAGEVEYNADAHKSFRDAFEWWLRPCDGIIDKLSYFERAGFHVKNAKEFRNCCREVTGILTPDAEFFADEKLVDLRDQALDDHRAGHTVEYRPS